MKNQNEHLGATDMICLDSGSDVKVCHSSFVKTSSQTSIFLDDNVVEVVGLGKDSPCWKDKFDKTMIFYGAYNKIVDSTETRKKSPLF